MFVVVVTAVECSNYQEVRLVSPVSLHSHFSGYPGCQASLTSHSAHSTRSTQSTQSTHSMPVLSIQIYYDLEVRFLTLRILHIWLDP